MFSKRNIYIYIISFFLFLALSVILDFIRANELDIVDHLIEALIISNIITFFILINSSKESNSKS